VQHAFYTFSNNPETKFADWVAYTVDPDLIGGPDRPRNWKADPDLEDAVTLEPDDYDNISDLGMDRGYQAPLEAFSGVVNLMSVRGVEFSQRQHVGLSRRRALLP
jgi:endonuclease G